MENKDEKIHKDLMESLEGQRYSFGVLTGIAIKGTACAPMESLSEADVTLEAGIIGDYRGAKSGKRERQVTVLSEEQWQDVCTEVGILLPWQARRANLLVRGIKFVPEHVGMELHFAPNIVLEITGETAPCSRMDEAKEGLMSALTPEWRGGVNCRVIKGGKIETGLPVFLQEPSR